MSKSEATIRRASGVGWQRLHSVVPVDVLGDVDVMFVDVCVC